MTLPHLFGCELYSSGPLKSVGDSALIVTRLKRTIYMGKQQISSIFVVDDEAVISESLAMILQISGFAATSFVSPLAALSSARASSPDLLISDVFMPELSGIDLAIQLKRLCPDCKILLISGHAGVAEMQKAAQAEGYEFNLLSKPIHPRDLISCVRSLDVQV